MADAGETRIDAPFHEGERAIQARLGVRERMERFGRRIIQAHLPEEHRTFYAALPFLVAAHVDSAGRPWASALAGRPGFVHSPDPQHIRIDARPVEGDPLVDALRPGRALGLLGLEFQTRRRNRANGRIVATHGAGVVLRVDQAFGNCPQYIQTRALCLVDNPRQSRPCEALPGLDDQARSVISAADTFFVASYAEPGGNPRVQGADASHRGGRPGFVRVDDQRTLTIPDYVGNFHFNTLGNFLVNPRAGMLFVDFERGDLLMLTGAVEIIWEGPEVDAFQGAERLWRFTLAHGLRLPGALPLRWRFGEYSPHTLMTGSWEEAEARLRAEAQREAWRGYRVVRIVDESPVVRSFYLEPHDGAGLLSYRAGQYLPLRVHPDGGGGEAVIRTYTLSSAPADPLYRISVKREGRISGYLHERVGTGDIIEAKAPRGRFTLDAAETRPALLLSGGIGITPMISMLRHAVQEGLRTRHFRPLVFVHSARTARARALVDEARGWAARAPHAVSVHAFVTRPAGATGASAERPGRIDRTALGELLPPGDCDVFLCGPAPFMQSMYDLLRELGVPDARIFTESFGPSALRRRRDEGAGIDVAQEAQEAVVEFARSKFEMPWTPEAGTLLELAEAHGLAPPYACRTGLCGTCAAALLEGEVAYRQAPHADLPDGQVLTCSAVPAKVGTSPARVVVDL